MRNLHLSNLNSSKSSKDSEHMRVTAQQILNGYFMQRHSTSKQLLVSYILVSPMTYELRRCFPR